MKELHYPAQTYVHDRDHRPTDFGQLKTDMSRRADHLSEHIPPSGSPRPTLTDSTRKEETARSAAGVVAARLLAVLVVVMVVTSILGFTVFDREGGNSATAVASLVIGSYSAVLGLLFGSLKAYLAS
ncbi:MAG TPA: hypothetical protein VFY56_00615 [Propionibacteriaceae bacterium]|nr:hypothetical protein [Propionibacteriaceae bacterium]